LPRNGGGPSVAWQAHTFKLVRSTGLGVVAAEADLAILGLELAIFQGLRSAPDRPSPASLLRLLGQRLYSPMGIWVNSPRLWLMPAKRCEIPRQPSTPMPSRPRSIHWE